MSDQGTVGVLGLHGPTPLEAERKIIRGSFFLGPKCPAADNAPHRSIPFLLRLLPADGGCTTAQLGADAVIVQGDRPQSQRDYWQYPKTSGIAIKYADWSFTALS